MTVTSEEKVLDAILMWCTQASESCGWATINDLLSSLIPEQIFRERLQSVDIFLPFVRFPLMPSSVLQKVFLIYSSYSKLDVLLLNMPTITTVNLCVSAAGEEQFK